MMLREWMTVVRWEKYQLKVEWVGVNQYKADEVL